MSIYSGFGTRNQEHYYDQILFNIMSTLLTRLLKFYRQQAFDEKHFILIMNKQIKYIQKMQTRKSFQYLEPKYGQILQYYLSCFAGELKMGKNQKQQQRKQKQQSSCPKSRIIYEEPQKQYEIQQQISKNKQQKSRIITNQHTVNKHVSPIGYAMNQNVFQANKKGGTSKFDRTFSTLGKQFLSIKNGIDKHMSAFQNERNDSQVPNSSNSKYQSSSLSKIVQKVPKGINKRKNRLENINNHRKIINLQKQQKSQQQGQVRIAKIHYEKRNFTQISNDYNQQLNRQQSFREQQDHSSIDRQSRSHTMVLVSELGSLPSIHETVVTKTKFNSKKKQQKIEGPSGSSSKLKQQQKILPGKYQNQVKAIFKSIEDKPLKNQRSSHEFDGISNKGEQVFQIQNGMILRIEKSQNERSVNLREVRQQQQERCQKYTQDCQQRYINEENQQIYQQQNTKMTAKKLILKKPLHYRSKMFMR